MFGESRNMLKLLPYVTSKQKRSRVPLYLIHFVTKYCNARCPHCFVYDENGKPIIDNGDDMSIDEIDKMTSSIGDTIYNVNLTGGETFLRKDIYEICQLYLKNTGIQVMQFFTNGYMTNRTVTTLEKLCREYPKRNFVVVISIDDIGETHNEYRKLKNGFEKGIKTYKKLRALNFSNLDLDIGLTVNHQNQHNLENIYDCIVKEHKIRTFSCTLVRGNPKDPASKNVDLEKYEKFSRRLEHGIKNGELDGFNQFAGGDLLNAKSIIMRNKVIPKVRKQGFVSPCYAGRLIGVVYSNGDVYPCEILETPMGNLREFDYSLPELWESAKSKELTNWIWESKCHCEHECFQTLNILFNKKYYPDLVKEYAKIKIGKIIN